MAVRPRCAWALFLVLAGAAEAQPPARDPQGAVEPRGKPGVGQKYLEQMVGEWDVAKAFYPRSGEPARATGECRQTMIHGGRFLKSDFAFGQGDARSTGTGIIGFDPATGHFNSIWFDSRQTRMSPRGSKEPFNGKEIVLYSRPAEEGQAETRQTRTVTRIEDGGRKIVHQQFALEEGGKERLQMEMVLTRR